MKEPDPPDALLREWKSPEPSANLDQRVITGYRSALPQPQSSPRGWRRFWTMRISVPVPAFVVAALAIVALFLWLRPSTAPAPPPQASGAVTRLNIDGFQPLPNGEARIVPASEVRK